jgi:hypothetical protein
MELKPTLDSFQQLDQLSASIMKECNTELPEDAIKAFFRTQERLASVYLTNKTLTCRAGLPVMPILYHLAKYESSISHTDLKDMNDLILVLQQMSSAAEERLRDTPNRAKKVRFSPNNEHFIIDTSKPSMEKV